MLVEANTDNNKKYTEQTAVSRYKPAIMYLDNLDLLDRLTPAEINEAEEVLEKLERKLNRK